MRKFGECSCSYRSTRSGLQKAHAFFIQHINGLLKPPCETYIIEGVSGTLKAARRPRRIVTPCRLTSRQLVKTHLFPLNVLSQREPHCSQLVFKRRLHLQSLVHALEVLVLAHLRGERCPGVSTGLSCIVVSRMHAQLPGSWLAPVVRRPGILPAAELRTAGGRDAALRRPRC